MSFTLSSYLQRPEDGAGGVHKEESQVTQNVSEGKQTLGHQDGMEGIPVFPLSVLHVLKLQNKQFKIWREKKIEFF